MKKTYSQVGFTLLELMVTLSIAAILLTVGVPSFNSLIKDSRLTTANNDLVSAFNIARSEAVKRGNRITVCKSDDQVSCATSNDWDQGWIVFTDENNSGSYDAATETLILVHEPLENSITAVGGGTITNYVSYVMSGKSQQAGGGLQSGTILIRDDRAGDYGRNLSISQTGRPNTVTGVTVP